MGNWDSVAWIEAYLYIVICVNSMARHRRTLCIEIVQTRLRPAGDECLDTQIELVD